jgi:hypothetical protein
VIAARWTFRLADGRTVTGPVQGSGGFVAERGGRERLLGAMRRARAGQPLAIYEPAPGHVRIFPAFTVGADGAPLDLDLRTVDFAP